MGCYPKLVLQHFYEVYFHFYRVCIVARESLCAIFMQRKCFPDFQLVMTGSPIFCNGKQTKVEKTDT
jgi:hypothetical protein